jgi:hypothetical protein
VPTNAWPGRERHQAKRLGRGGPDRLPDVDAHLVAQHCHLVDQRDVDVPERVLQQLGQLGRAGRGDGHDLLDHLLVEQRGHGGRLRRGAAHDAGRVAEMELGIAGVDALGREGQQEVTSDPQARGLQQRCDQLVGGAGIGGRFEITKRPPTRWRATSRQACST